MRGTKFSPGQDMLQPESIGTASLFWFEAGGGDLRKGFEGQLDYFAVYDVGF